MDVNSLDSDALEANLKRLLSTERGAQVAFLERCLRVVVEQAAKRADPAALDRRPPPRPHDENSPYISADVERQVRQRDQNRCASPTPEGTCGSTYKLQVHHVVPFAKGGKTTLSNLRLACQPHNLSYARLDFGDAFIDAKIRASRGG